MLRFAAQYMAKAHSRLTFLLCVALFLCTSHAGHAQALTVTNVFENHYNYSYPVSPAAVDCPNGYNIDSSQYAPAGFHLERGHAIHHLDPKTPANDYWVYWAHFDSSNYGVAEVAIFKSTSECGPYQLQTNLYTGNTPGNVTDPNAPYSTDGYGYGFRPGGWQSRDEIVFRDAATQTYNPDGTVASYASAYLYTASNSLNTISGHSCSYANDSLAAFKMTPDYLGIDTTTSASTNGANWIFPCAQREAPVLFRSGSYYFLVVSQAAGWYPSQGAYGSSANPLTGFQTSPLPLGNTSTFGGQTSDGFTIAGTQANSYILQFDHLGGDDSKNPSYTGSRRDSGLMYLPLLLNESTGTATLNWAPSFTVDLTTGVLTLPTLPNLASGATATATTYSGTNNPPSSAIDGSYTTRWAAASSAGTSSLVTGSASFNATTSKTSTPCPVTNATSSTTCNPSLVVDVGSVQPIQEIDLSWYMIKGSETYYNFKVSYSSDNVTWNTLDYTAYASGSNTTAANISAVPFSNNVTYGFNSLPVNFSARYVAVVETGEVVQNNSVGNYGPNLYEIGVIQSTAPTVAQAVNVTATTASAAIDPSTPTQVNIAVTGPTGQPTPSGYVQLSAPGYTSDTYGLVNGATTFTIPAGALTGGAATLTANYRPDPSSAPVYGIATSTGTTTVNVTSPDAPSNLTVTQSSPQALTASWTSSPGATSYVIYRSVAGGSYTQLATAIGTSYTDTGLNTSGATYCYTVASVNNAGTGSPSSPACSTATANFPVSGVAVAQSGPGALTVSYTALANATSYVIKRSANGGAFSTIATPTTTSYVDSGLAADGTNYCYTVAAVFSTGTASDSSPVCATASNSFAPTDVQVTPWASGQLYITWAASSTGTTYTVKRSMNGGAYTSLGTSSIPTYTDTGLTNDTNTYCYVVDAVLNNVSSSDSTAVCSTPVSSFLSVNNFSFESPSVPLWSTGPNDISNGTWTYVGSSGSSNGNNSGLSATSGTWTNQNTPPTVLGSQVAFLEGTGSVTQSISGFTVGRVYAVHVAASQRQTTSQSGANPISVKVNGSNIATLNPLQSIKYYRDFSAGFTAAASTNSLAFAGTSTSTTSAVLIDNIRITSTGSTALQIGVSPMTISQGTAYAVLTATQSYSGVAPSGHLVFQVGNGDQVAGNCSASNGSQVCSANYPTGSLSVGANPVTVTYQGDANYAAATGSGTLTVNDASTGTVQLISTAPLTRLSDGSYQATVTVSNNGTTTAAAATLKSLTAGSASAAAVPVTLGDIPPGGALTVTLSIPSSAGASGSTVVERLSGSYTGGSFGSSSRTRLP